MIGLGNSCGGMKSPPLLVAALLACIIVLGFNYWIASSRSVDLQNRVMELEVRVRRAAAERGAVELKKNEFQGELEKQREQIDKIQSLHSFQMENANKIHQEEKATLMNNITTNERLMQSLQEHLKELQTEYGKLQLDVYRFQKNQTNLQRKFSYDLSQCINQMKELKEQCEERINELTKKGSDIPKDKENKEASEDSNKNPQVSVQPSAFKQAELQQAGLGKPKADGDAPGVAPTAKREDSSQTEGDRVAVGKHEPGAEEETLLREPQPPPGSPRASAGPAAEALLGEAKRAAPERATDQGVQPELKPQGQKRPGSLGWYPPLAVNPADGVSWGFLPRRTARGVRGWSALRDGRWVKMETSLCAPWCYGGIKLINLNIFPDKQGHEALNQDKDIDYNLDENEAESETDKQAALTGLENDLHVPKHEDNVKNHLLDQVEEQQKL
ncbi:Golgi membrane protein 1 [Eudromia elegans]